MPNITPIYNFYYLENGDIIYPQFDKNNFLSVENEIAAAYSYIGQGIVSGWQIYWMGCRTNPFVMQQRQALLDAYKTNRFSFNALQYESLNYPITEADWEQCVVVTPGSGVIGVFHVSTEVNYFFRFNQSNDYYIWAQTNVCTNTEYLCQIVAPQYPDPDYDLFNPAIYIGEVYCNTVNGSVSVTQISYSTRRNNLQDAQGQLQQQLQQALINHVHSGEGNQPSKINLSTKLTISVSHTSTTANAFIFSFPSGFNPNNYNTIPQVYLNGVLLNSNQYQINGNVLYLQNSIPSAYSLNIVYQLAPGTNIFITSDYTQSDLNITGNYVLSYTPTPNGVYYLTDGTTNTQPDGSTWLNIFKWDNNQYSFIEVYLSNQLLPSSYYILNNSLGTLQFVGPILPSILNYYEKNVYIKFVTPSVQVQGLLSGNRIGSINASAFKAGILSKSRITGLDHLGFFKNNITASIIPYKKLLNSGNNILFFPEIDCPIQHADYIINSATVDNIKINNSESTIPSRTVLSTANGLYVTNQSPLTFDQIVQLPWNTDLGEANIFSENYYGNFANVTPDGVDVSVLSSVNPKLFWVLSKQINQFINVLYLSSDFGLTYQKITPPQTLSGSFDTINDFIFTLDVEDVQSGSVVITHSVAVYYVLYLAAPDGFYSARIPNSQNPTRPTWLTPSTNVANAPTGSVNKLSEAVNIAITATTSDTGGTTKTFNNIRILYAACDYGLFLYSGSKGTLFTTLSNNYNVDNSHFNFVKWLGLDTGSSNTAQNIVWGDNYGIYFTQSAQHYVISSSDSNGNSTTQDVFNQPLSATYNTYTVAVATTANLNLSNTVTQIDGYNLNNNDLVLVKNQNNLNQNGIYIYSSITNLLNPVSTNPTLKILVTNGTLQSQTEWIDLYTGSSTQRNFGLWFANIIPLTNGDYITSVVLDKSQGPSNGNYANSFFVSTKYNLYRVLITQNSPGVYPIVIQLNWNYGIITGLQHYQYVNNLQNGLLVVFTENGIYKTNDFLNYTRFINKITSAQATQASVYDDYTFNEYIGSITSVGLATSTIMAPNGTYNNINVYSDSKTGQGLIINAVVNNNAISSISINNAGQNYTTDSQNCYAFIAGNKVNLTITTQGIFIVDQNSQGFTYSKSTGLTVSRLLYEVDYSNFYISPWTGFPLVTVQGNGISTFTYNNSLGLIHFIPSLSKNQKNSILVSLANRGQYIYNVGNTPHPEIFNILAAQANPVTTVSATIDPSLSNSPYLLNVTYFDSSQFTSNVTLLKITGSRPISNGSTILSTYSEIIQVEIDTINQKIYVFNIPSGLQITANSNIYITVNFPNILGIEDQITLFRSNLTYHMDSVNHENIYNLYNSLNTINSNIFNYPVVPNENLYQVNRGLQNTFALNNISQFDPLATYIGYEFGVDPTSTDIAASPSFINLILYFAYGTTEIFATNKGIWSYIRSSSTWVKNDSVGNSSLLYFANLTLTDSTNTTYTYAGTNLGLFYQINGTYVLNSLFNTPVTALNMGSWYYDTSQSTDIYHRYEAYGKTTGLSFVLRIEDKNKNISLKSDFFEGHQVYDIYYDTFNRYDDNGNKTIHPAIYVATDASVYAFTTDSAPNTPGPDTAHGHYLLVWREMFGTNIIKNPNKINPNFPGIASKIYKIFPLPPGPGSNVTWLAICTSNGTYVVINWKQCDVGDPNGLNFYPINNNSKNKSIGYQCYCIVAKSNDTNNQTYFIGTDLGVLKSVDRCNTWVPVSKFVNAQYAVSDLKYFVNANVGYLIAATSGGLYVSADDGSSWLPISQISDINIQISNKPVNGPTLNEFPTQTFNTITSGTVNKAFIYFDPTNLSGTTTLYATISYNGITTNSSTSVILSSGSGPGMYGFAFTNVPISSNNTYKLGVINDSNTYAKQINWVLSTLNSPYPNGSAYTSGGILPNQDFFFRINLNTPPNPIQIIEPVGFYNNNYSVGFASGTFYGCSISTNGSLYSNVGIICNIVLDTSRSMEINDLGVITQNGVSTGYVKQAIINAIALGTSSVYNRLLNGYGTSKLLVSIYGYNETINDLLFYSTSGSSGSSNCFSSSNAVYAGYTNNTSSLQNAISYVSNTGRSSKLYDAALFNSRLQYPSIINSFYSQNLSLIDSNFINIQSIINQYQQITNDYLLLNLNLVNSNGITSTYNMNYNGGLNPFVYLPNTYSYGLVIYSDNTSSLISPNNYTTGVYTDYSGKLALTIQLSNDWPFDPSINGLSTNYNSMINSVDGLNLGLTQYSYSFKPLIIITTDGNDNSNASPLDVNGSLMVSWRGNGSQMLVVEPGRSGNENYLRDMIQNTKSELFMYNSYPENQLKNILITNDNLNLYTSYWTRNYDFESPQFISNIFTSYNTPGNSQAIVKFKWSSDRINFSNYIILNNNQFYILNQKVLSIYYRIDFVEDFINGQRLLPNVSQLYHISVIPSTQTFITLPQTVNGQIFETLASIAFTNNSLISVTPIVGRTFLIDPTYYETTNLNRNGALANRQTSFRITPAYTVTGLSLFPFSTDSDGNLNYLGFYVVDSDSNIYSWGPNDTFQLFNGSQPVNLNTGYITVIPNAGVVQFSLSQGAILPNGNYQYTLYSANINYAETSQNIIGEPTTTSDYRTYFLRNGRIPPDAKVVVLINQVIYRGIYTVSYYDGTITFATPLDASSYVTVFIKFASTFRVGVQIQSYSSNNIALQNFNFTYTSLPDLTTYSQSLVYSKPYLTSLPLISPVIPNINSTLQVGYAYTDNTGAPENNTTITWWRKRTGIEYVLFNPAYNIPITGTSFIGLSTFNITSLYNQSANPFILSVTINSSGTNANVTNVVIQDRGTNFIGTGTNIINTVTLNNGAILSNIGNAITAYTLTPPILPGYVTSDFYVKINPNSPIGYATNNVGTTSSIISSFPLYDNLISERSIDVGTRGLFDGRDLIFVTVTPSNGIVTGNSYNSNIVTINLNYTPYVTNLNIQNSIKSNGISTSYTISAKNNQIGIYSYYSGIPNDNPITQYSSNLYYNQISWYKYSSTGINLISTQGVLTSSLINPNDQIFYTIIPGSLNSDGTIGYGNTAYSETYTVTP